MADSQARIILSAVDKTSGVFAQVQKNLGGIGMAASSLTTMLSGIGATTALVGLAGLIKRSADAIDQFNDLKDATGASIENISALDHIARETGGSFDQVSSILVKFNGVLKDADPTKGAGAVLKSLNLDIEELKQLDPAEALRQTAVALSQYADDGDKARAVQELFGKSVKDTAAFMKDLSEQSSLNAAVTTEQSQEVEKFNKELFKLQAAADEAGRALTIGMIAALNESIGKFRAAREEGQGYVDLLKDLAKYASLITGPAGALGIAARSFGDAPAKQGSRFVSGGITNEADQSSAELARLKRGAPPKQSLRIPVIGGGSGARSGGGSSRANATRPTRSSGLSYDDQITQRAGKLLEDSDVTKAKEYADTLAKLDSLYMSGAIGGQLYDSAVSKLSGSTAKAGEAGTELADQQARLAQLLAGTASAALEEQRNDMLLLAAAYEKGTITVRQFEEAASARLGLTGPDAQKASNSFSETLHGDVKDALSQAFRDSKNPVEAFGDALGNVVFTRLSSGIGNALADALLGSGGRGGGLLSGATDFFSSLLSFDGGGHTGNLPRSGGMDGKGGFLAMLHPRETVVDHTKGQGAGAPINITIQNTIGNVASQTDVVSGMQTVRAQIMGELQRSMRYGGAAA